MDVKEAGSCQRYGEGAHERALKKERNIPSSNRLGGADGRNLLFHAGSLAGKVRRATRICQRIERERVGSEGAGKGGKGGGMGEIQG